MNSATCLTRTFKAVTAAHREFVLLSEEFARASCRRQTKAVFDPILASEKATEIFHGIFTGVFNMQR